MQLKLRSAAEDDAGERPSWPYGRVGHHRASGHSTRGGADGRAVKRGYDERAGAGPRGALRVGRGTRGTGQASERDRGSDRAWRSLSHASSTPKWRILKPKEPHQRLPQLT